jgi:hypothetical protein
VKRDVLADHGDFDGVGRRLHLLDHVDPRLHVPLASRQLEPMHDLLVETLLHEDDGHFVDRVLDVRFDDHRIEGHVAEEPQLALHVGFDFALGAADEHVRLNTDLAQLGHGVLRRLRLDLAGGAQEREKRQVDEHDAIPALFESELADRFEERKRFDVADRSADFRQDDVPRRPSPS